MSAPSYRYSPLTEPDSIRLLLLQPSQSPDATPACTLLHTTLSACDYDLLQPYTALSYVWGDPSSSGGHVLLDGVPKTVTPNLLAALRDLRDPHRERRLWVDALCIDQSSLAERNSQVRLMGRIYATANHTVIHLGPLTPSIDHVLSNVSSRWSRRAIDAAERQRLIGRAREDLLSHPWFRRVWILQELVLSQDPWVQCGAMRVRWVDLVALLVQDRLALRRVHHADGDGVDALQLLNDMEMQRGRTAVSSLLYLLTLRRGLGATDPRDFIYAQLGLARDLDTVQQYLDVDYARPTSYVFARAARYVFDTVGVQVAITHCDALDPSQMREGLPTWAPDWSRGRSYAIDMYTDTAETRLRLSGKYVLAVDEPPLPQVLLLVGYAADIVEETTAIMPPFDVIDPALVSDYITAEAELQAFYRSWGGSYASGDQYGQYVHISLRGREAQHEALCQTLSDIWLRLLLGKTFAKSPDHELNTVFAEQFRNWLYAQSGAGRIFLSADSQGLTRLLWLYMYRGQQGTVLEGRRLARTAIGTYAVVPASAQSGDRIVYLAGTERAVLIRDRMIGDEQSNEEALRAAVVDADLSLSFAQIKDFSWAASRDHVKVEHCFLLGESYADGQVGFSLRHPPKKKDIAVYSVY